MRSLSAVVLVVLLTVLPSCKFFKNKGLFGKKEKALAALLAQRDSIRIADSLRKVQENLIALENAKLDSIRLADEEENVSQSRYNIIVGSFVTPEYATGLAEVYRQQGYESKILKMDGTSFDLVVAESHESFNKAVERLEAFQDTVEIDAWLFIKK